MPDCTRGGNRRSRSEARIAFAVHGRGHFSREEPNRPASRYDGVKRAWGPLEPEERAGEMEEDTI
jgi:hypothetical protein